MTPTELKVQTLKKLETELTKYMDSVIPDWEFTDSCVNIINEFVEQYGEL